MTRAGVISGWVFFLCVLAAGCSTHRKWSTTSADAFRAYEEGVTHWERFYYTEATAAFEKAIAADSGFALPWGRLAMLHMNTLDEALARRESARAMTLSITATQHEQLLVRLWHYRVMYDYVRAAAVADSLIKEYPDDPEAFLERGQMFEMEKNLEAAAGMYERSVDADTGFALGIMSLGYVSSNMGEQDRAVSFMQRYIQMAPGAADPLASYADILVLAGRYNEALEQYRASLAVKPDYWYSVREIGSVYVILGRLQLAERQFDQSLSMIPASPATNVVRLRLHAYLDMQRGDYEGAVGKLSASIKADSSVFGNAVTLTTALAKLRRFGEAGDLIRQSLEELRQKHLTESPTMQAYHLMRARVLTEEQKYTEAEDACKSALEFSSPLMRGAVYVQLARIHLAARRYELALDAVEGALGVNPNAPDALLVLVKIYHQQGDSRMVHEVGGRLLELWKDADPDFIRLAELRTVLGVRR
jgi:tetratricopeptide (TPR) repeat protein